MTSDQIPLDDLQRSIDDALRLLRREGGSALDSAGLLAEPLPSLLAQCETLCAQAPDTAPIRSIHHFACTGGTLISRCLATMPNITLLSEIDPLSRMQTATPQYPFLPTDLIYGARVALRPIDDSQTMELFDAALASLHQILSARGSYLVLRDHAHSQFCSDTAPVDRPTLRELIARSAPVLSVVTVRHPLDSWLSLKNNNWVHFTPGTLEEYSQRYLHFLSLYRGQKKVRYEDFVAAPDRVLEEICNSLDLAFVPGSEDLVQVVSISGDSGRKTGPIAPRPRRAIPDDVANEAAQSAGYAQLCDALGYDPDVAISAAGDE